MMVNIIYLFFGASFANIAVNREEPKGRVFNFKLDSFSTVPRHIFDRHLFDGHFLDGHFLDSLV